jgi:hypothetical protein
MTSRWIDPDDGTITELPGETPISSGGPHPRGGGLASAYVFAAGVLVGVTLMLAVRDQPTATPDAATRNTASPAASSPATPHAEPSPEPIALGSPVHLAAGTPVDIEIDGMLVSLSVPDDWEGDYYAPHLLAVGRPQEPSLVLTTTTQVGSGCLDPDRGDAGSAVPTSAPPAATGPPGTNAVGPVPFLLDGYAGRYFNFPSPADACQPNHVFDSIVGPWGPRGPEARLQLWVVDVKHRWLAFGLYTARNTPQVILDEVRAVVATARVISLGQPTAGLTAADVHAGLIGLPPAGAPQTDAQQAILVAQYDTGGAGGPSHGTTRLYDDGRLIWFKYHRDGSTGLVEQRLTPVGTAMVAGHVSVADKDPLVLAEWLPSSAWADATLRPYVPTDYGVCLSANEPWAALQQGLMQVLPPDAADLLRGRSIVEGFDESLDCRRVSTAEAATLDAALRNQDFESDGVASRYVLEYQRDGVSIIFEPILPDGTLGCSFCS